ncbi:peptidylprolyl isomerase, partial [Burkholderia pseudomallei]
MDTIDETLEARPHARVSVNGVEIGAAEIADERAHHADADDQLDAAERARGGRDGLRRHPVALPVPNEQG